MLEYHTLRWILSLFEFGLVLLILRKDAGYLCMFGILMFFQGVSGLVPAKLNDDLWVHLVQMPMLMATSGLAIAATLEIFAFMPRRTFREERRWLFGASVATGLITSYAVYLINAFIQARKLTAASFLFWHQPPENWYQALMHARQYVMICLLASYCTAWVWVTVLRPVRMETQIKDHGEVWALWLATMTVMATTVKGGIFWTLQPWSGSGGTWTLAGGILMMAQVWICLAFALNLWSWRDEAIAFPAILASWRGSLLSRKLHRDLP